MPSTGSAVPATDEPSRPATVVLLGTLDTKGAEYGFLRDRIVDLGCHVLLVDAGVRSGASSADVGPDEVAAAAEVDRAALAADDDRGAAVAAMARGAAEVVRRLHADGRLDGIAALGGSGGSSIAAAAMQALPVGVPKLLVSTMASGDTRAFVGTSDVAMLYPVVDIAGINSLSEVILTNAAAAIAGMADASRSFRSRLPARPRVAATMYGVTTPCVSVARAWLERHGYEVLVFHATGSGGRAMEGLVRSGFVSAVLDVTTSELVDEVVGGSYSAGPHRLDAAAACGIPQVVSIGGADQCTFGPPDTVPPAFADRQFLPHNPAITLMRTTPAENAEVGRLMARKLNRAAGPVTVFLPRGGVSSISVPGGPFHDPAADAALIDALRDGLRPGIDVVESARDINDPVFATAMAERLHEQCRSAAGAEQQGELEHGGIGAARPAAASAGRDHTRRGGGVQQARRR